jgi:hypothetical protein
MGLNWKGFATMSLLDALRKGFGFFLMSMGVSSPAKKPKPAPKPDAGNSHRSGPIR